MSGHTTSSVADKWDAIYTHQECKTALPAEVLQQNLHLLPQSGAGLDLACGLGGNAICMAKHGIEVDAWDVSSVAIDKINDYVDKHKIKILTQQRDIENDPPSPNTYDVVVVSYFLYRPILKNICKCLKSDGLLFYQTFCAEKVTYSDHITGPKNPNYLLNKNELLSVCEGMQILVYREEGLQGDIHKGWRNQAMIVAKKID